MCVSHERTKYSNFDLLMLETAALDNLAISPSSSILDSKLLALKWIN